MHKRFVNNFTIDFSIIPRGPILIKSGQEGADPTKPDMEFVETYHQGKRSIYLPGSSLKGAIRAHAERIVRTVGQDNRPNDPAKLWASDPLNDKYEYLHKNDNLKDEKKCPPEIYKLSSFTDQLFGNVKIASRLRIEDAYPTGAVPRLEERNGVAIDRVFGSVAVGPFNFQVCTEGEFRTKIHLKNFTLAQLALVGLVLRDFHEGWFGLGFAKSRGLGTVELRYHQAIAQYPGCILNEDNQRIEMLGNPKKNWSRTSLLGAGEFLKKEERLTYGFPQGDVEETPVPGQEMNLGLGVELRWEGDERVPDIFRRAVNAWKKLLKNRRAAA
ncbi:MAG: RAMP superfamily CRISPR-associated protein [Cyanobacteriota bacterium]|nr:RAMP superfamily CRISPR-associated protein [Cyanobacteriota bacterium]